MKLVIPELRLIREEVAILADEQRELSSNSSKHEKALRYLFEQVSNLQKAMR